MPAATVTVRMSSRGTLAMLALVAVVLVAGCATQPPGGGAARGTVTPTVSTAPAGLAISPAVLIVDPPFDGGVSAGTVTVSVRVTGFALIPPSGENREGAGHLVYYRDVAPPAAPGGSALTAPGTCIASAETRHSWEEVSPGTHTFAVQLVNADDTPLDPPALDAVDVTAVSPGMVQVP